MSKEEYINEGYKDLGNTKAGVPVLGKDQKLYLLVNEGKGDFEQLQPQGNTKGLEIFLSKLKEIESTAISNSKSTDIVVKPTTGMISNIVPTMQNYDFIEEQLNKLQQFVNKLLKKEVDYGKVVKGGKNTLFKSGAEKLLFAFGLISRVELVKKIEDWDNGFFHYTYNAEIIHPASGTVIANCEGSANTKERVFNNQDPFMTNNISKRAQKRAFVGATLIATRSSMTFEAEE